MEEAITGDFALVKGNIVETISLCECTLSMEG